MMRRDFMGVGTALVTPFTRSGDLDEAAVRRLARRAIGAGVPFLVPCGTTGDTPALTRAAVRRLARRQIDAGVHFLIPCGTTGETPTLTEAERLRTVEIVVEEAAGKV